MGEMRGALDGNSGHAAALQVFIVNLLRLEAADGNLAEQASHLWRCLADLPQLKTVKICQISILNQNAAALEINGHSILQHITAMTQIRCSEITVSLSFRVSTSK